MYTSDKEDSNLFARVEDAFKLSSVRSKPYFIGFLNEREQYIISERYNYAFERISFYGGYDNAERRIMCACDYKIADEEFLIEKLCFKFRREASLSHRDFLGSFMSLGIERSCVGDIIVGEGFAAAFVKSEVSDYIKSQISKIGRTGVRFVCESECELSYEPEAEAISCVVSSMRLDAVVAAMTKLSRGKSAVLITSGKVFTNYTENRKVSYPLKPDDVLTIRGKGKFIIKEQSSTTKKGRLRINIVHYR